MIKNLKILTLIIYQKKDDLSFERILNVPKRSIGDTTLKLINETAKKNSFSLEEASKFLIEMNKIKPKTKIGLTSLLNLLEKWRVDLNIKKIENIGKVKPIIGIKPLGEFKLLDYKNIKNNNILEKNNIKTKISAILSEIANDE